MRSILLITSALFALTVVSCYKDDGTTTVETGDPVLVVHSSEVTASASGGTYSVLYAVQYPTSTGYIEYPVSGAEWVHSFSVDEVTGEIFFTVDANTGEETRETQVTVLYSDAADPAVFTVVQYESGKVALRDLMHTGWEATFLEFDKEETIFTVASESNYPTNITITAWEFAQKYAEQWNKLYPYDLIDPEYAMSFEFVDGSHHTVTIGENNIDVWQGNSTISTLIVSGTFEFDEDTGIMTVDDRANNLYNRTTKILLTLDGDELLYRVVYTEHYMQDWIDAFGNDDYFRSLIADFEGTKYYLSRYLQFRLRLLYSSIL